MAERPRRTRPLTVASLAEPPSAPPTIRGRRRVVVPSPPLAGDAAAASEASGYQRLAEGVRSLRTGGGTLNFSEHTLMVLGGIIAPLGLVIVILGWYGAAHSPFLFQQVPYLISGSRARPRPRVPRVVLLLRPLDHRAGEGRPHAVGRDDRSHRSPRGDRQAAGRGRPARRAADGDGGVSPNGAAAGDLVATGKGTMAHRPDCVVVAGKPGLRRVAPDEGLVSCKLCDPYAEAAVTQ